ncbi:MAG: transporter substrate-binding domain-containing protein [Kordiimonadaceae bacterium]|nr:transporter substrate-binding domain-containing protein [Kordiimonadaceae bacterium]
MLNYFLNNNVHCYTFITTFFLSFFSLSASVSAQEAQLTEEEQQWLAEHPVIRSTSAMDWAPIDFTVDGKATGLSIDYLNLIAEKIGFKIEYINGQNWTEHLEMLKAREIDITHSASKTTARSEFLNFSEAYLELPTVYYGRRV